MSRGRPVRTRCKCGEELTLTLWDSVNTCDEELAYAFLSGVINSVLCPSCDLVCFIPVPVLYHDLERGLMIWIYDSRFTDNPAKQAHAEETPVMKDLRKCMGIKTITVDGFGWALEALRRLDDPEMLSRIREKHPNWNDRKVWEEAFLRHYKHVKSSGWDRDRLIYKL